MALLYRKRAFADPLKQARPPMRRLFAVISLFALNQAAAQVALRLPAPSPQPSATPGLAGYRSPSELKKLPLEQLVDVEITSAARRPEPLSRAASAVDVITDEDIRRSGVTNLPDALRLAPEMEVAQIDGHDWAISTRGFNISTANKLQVLMDGRTLYTPLFSGVFWDVQQTFLPDVDQIEIIRGPGATLWGANAVNGVINIRTKPADETQGFLLWGGAGNEETGFGGVRYGGMLGADTAFRLYVTHQSRDSLVLSNGADAQDEYDLTQGGFRMDSKLSRDDLLTFQGDAYGGSFGQLSGGDIEVDGQNVIGRWTHELDENSGLTIQAYFDRTHRLVPDVFEESRDTYDLEFEHRFWIGNHDLIYGANYRGSHDDIGNSAVVAFLPATETEHLVSGYLQDEWHLVPDLFSLIGGSKFEWNSFSGFEVQPSGRFLWTPTKEQTIWGAISRAVRTPTRLDEDVIFFNTVTGAPFVLGNKNFDPEVVIAYELGYRLKPTPQISFDVAGYYNDYDNLRSVEPRPDGTLVIENLLKAQTYGGTLSTRWQVTDWWRLDGSVSLFHLNVDQSNSQDVNHGRGEGNDPETSFIIHSAVDLWKGVKFDSYLRYVDSLPAPATPSYLELDARLAWSPCPDLELAIVGRNLLDNAHPEFAGTNPMTNPTREVERSVYATIRWSF
jgi:iron complex outermembrane receptor protein